MEDAARTLNLYLQQDEAWPADATLYEAVIFDDGAVLGHPLRRHLGTNRGSEASGREAEMEENRVLLIPKGCRRHGAESSYAPEPERNVSASRHAKFIRFSEFSTQALRQEWATRCADVTRWQIMDKWKADHPNIQFAAATHKHHSAVVAIAQPMGQAYFHFLLENLAKVHGLLLTRARRGLVFIQLAAKAKGRRYVREFFELLGVGEEMLVYGAVSADVAIIPEPIACGSPGLFPVLSLRKNMFSARRFTTLDLPMPPSACMVLVVKRIDGDHRRLANSLTVLGTVHMVARAKGCSVLLHTGREKVSQQIDLFQHATALVAPHGAGLSHIFMMQPSSLVLEIIPAPLNLCYMKLAVALGLWYVPVTALGTNEGLISVDARRLGGLLDAYSPA